MLDRVLDDVQEFFLEHPFGGLVLPDGWFGRPYDNWLQFTCAEMSDGELRVHFAHDEKAILTGYIEVEVTENLLMLRGFSVAEWHWKAYGTNVWKKRHYSDGQLEFLGRPIGRDQ